MTLYGFSREPDSPDTDDDPSSAVPQQRAASAPVPVPADHPSSGDINEGVPVDVWAPAAAPAVPDLWGSAPVPAEPEPWAPASQPAEPDAWSASPPAEAEPWGSTGQPVASNAWGAATPSGGSDAWAPASEPAGSDLWAAADQPAAESEPWSPTESPPALPKRTAYASADLDNGFPPAVSPAAVSPAEPPPSAYTSESARGYLAESAPPYLAESASAYLAESASRTYPAESARPHQAESPTRPAESSRTYQSESVQPDQVPLAPRPVRAEVPVPPATDVPAAAELPTGKTDHDWIATVPVPDDDDDDEIIPWDRRPLMVVIAGGLALIVLAILSGVAATHVFSPSVPAAGWQPVLPAPPPGPAATPSAPAGAAAGGAGAITLSGVGDVIMGTEPGDLPPNGGTGMFDRVKTALAADVVMGNLETPLTPDTGRVKCATSPPASPSASAPATTDCYQFHLPPSYANHLRDAGFTVMNLANNHTNDMGPAGLTNTRDALEAAKVQHTGAPNEITYVEAKGVKVAVIGFAPVYSWGQNLNNIPAAVKLVEKADEQADIVVIQMQGGAEGADKTHVRSGPETFAGENRGDLMKFTHAVVDAGADVVFGHGPHVMRGMEFYKGRLIAYSLGNFCGYGVLSSTGINGVGGVLKVSLNKDGSWANGKLVSTAMVQGGLAAPDSQNRALTLVAGLSKDDFGANAATISTTDGAITAPAA